MFGTEIAKTAIGLWHGDIDSLQYVGDSANLVYSFIKSRAIRFLRLTSSQHRTKEQIQAELDFIAHLHYGGVKVALPVPSAVGGFIEEVRWANNIFFASVFEKAEGEKLKYDPARNKEHFVLRGRTLGEMHALSKTYVPCDKFRRFSWDEDKLLVEANSFLPKSEKTVWRAYDQLRDLLQTHPKSKQTYGLIHGDFGETNYLSLDGKLNTFDFDDCCYHWFVYDLAITIYPHGWRKEGSQLLDWLLQGYSERMILHVTLRDLTMFCQWRLVYMFLVYARRSGFENLSERQIEWFARKRENIAHGYKWHV